MSGAGGWHLEGAEDAALAEVGVQVGLDCAEVGHRGRAAPLGAGHAAVSTALQPPRSPPPPPPPGLLLTSPTTGTGDRAPSRMDEAFLSGERRPLTAADALSVLWVEDRHRSMMSIAR